MLTAHKFSNLAFYFAEEDPNVPWNLYEREVKVAHDIYYRAKDSFQF